MYIFDKTAYEEKLQALSTVFKHRGHALGKLRNFAEVPLFLDSKASRLIQMADLIAYWIFRYYQSGDDRGYRLIAPHFHRVRGVQHGLCKQVTAECEARLAALPPAEYPFPPASPTAPRAATADTATTAVLEVTVATATATVALPAGDPPPLAATGL